MKVKISNYPQYSFQFEVIAGNYDKLLYVVQGETLAISREQLLM